jgi:multidrug efflux pump subunit AcrA (membrane-fusion protein)
VPETRLVRLRKDQAATVTLDGGTEIKGRVRLVSPEVDRTTRLGRIRILVDAHPALRVGTFARGHVIVAQSSGLGVPSSAIQHLADGPIVQIARDGKVVVAKVKLGLTSGARTEILDGISDKDLVVVRAGTFLRAGDAVRPILTGSSTVR